VDGQCTPGAAADLGAFGEVLLRQDGADAGMARQIELKLQPVDLAMDEIVLLNVTYANAGVVAGGYVIVLAHPAWFKSSLFPAPTTGANQGDPVVTTNPKGVSPAREDLRDLVIRFNPHARATLELAEQLAPLLPIESPERIGKELRVGGEAVDSALLMQFAKGMMPIKDETELVHKIALVLRLASVHGEAHRPTLSAATARFLDQLHSVEPGGRGPIPVLYGTRSMFRLEDAK
jgi:hypothetical protein